MEAMETKQDYKFELHENEETGYPVIDMGELAEYVSGKTGLTVEQIVAAQDAELEYLRKCGLTVEEE